jgi:hypothetical protein
MVTGDGTGGDWRSRGEIRRYISGCGAVVPSTCYLVSATHAHSLLCVLSVAAGGGGRRVHKTGEEMRWAAYVLWKAVESDRAVRNEGWARAATGGVEPGGAGSRAAWCGRAHGSGSGTRGSGGSSIWPRFVHNLLQRTGGGRTAAGTPGRMYDARTGAQCPRGTRYERSAEARAALSTKDKAAGGCPGPKCSCPSPQELASNCLIYLYQYQRGNFVNLRAVAVAVLLPVRSPSISPSPAVSSVFNLIVNS